MTNVSEIAAPLMQPVTDVLETRHILQEVEALPHTRLREGLIERQELQRAVRAFDSKASYAAIDPYVNRWDEVLFESVAPTQMYVGYRLDEMIFSLWRGDPKSLLHSCIPAF